MVDTFLVLECDAVGYWEDGDHQWQGEDGSEAYHHAHGCPKQGSSSNHRDDTESRSSRSEEDGTHSAQAGSVGSFTN